MNNIRLNSKCKIPGVETLVEAAREGDDDVTLFLLHHLEVDVRIVTYRAQEMVFVAPRRRAVLVVEPSVQIFTYASLMNWKLIINFKNNFDLKSNSEYSYTKFNSKTLVF